MSPAEAVRPDAARPERPEGRFEKRLAELLQSRQSHSALRDFQMLRYVPGSSPLHRMWAGSKLIAIMLLSAGLLLWPSWQSTGIAGAILLVALLAARLPAGVFPRLPKGLWVLLGIWFAVAALAGGPPELTIGSVHLGVGGIEAWARLMVLAIELLLAAALLGWTTPLADLSPALGRLAGPLRRLKLPVDEVIGTVALSIRCLPLLFEEMRVLRAARRSRRPAATRSLQQLLEEAFEIVLGALANAIRRARELAEAIESRGGVPTLVPEHHRLRPIDAVALVVPALGLAAMALLR